MNALLLWLAWSHIFQIVLCIYYHDPSHVVLTGDGAGEHTQFGFSIGYQDGRPGKLVIGAPYYDENGKVFSCSTDNIFRRKNLTCNEVNINITSLAGEYTRTGIPDQKFMLGASIAATPDYFLTCAPLWSSEVEKNYTKKISTFGTCFIYNDTAYRYNGLYETYSIHENYRATVGSIGWRTLVDYTNNILIISKPSIPPLLNDILQVPLEEPLELVNLLALDQNEFRKEKAKDKSRVYIKRYLKPFRNLGVGLASGKFFDDTTYYAVSFTNEYVCGMIIFLEYSKTKKLYILKMTKYRPKVILENEIPGSMFGAALDGKDLNKDGLSELIVGAPAQTDDDSMADVGAVYIYLGGDVKTINDPSRMRMIMSTDDGSRFGSSITTNDLDVDGLPEILVSAPYRNSGEGALYIISGYEVYHQLLNHATRKKIDLPKLKLTQRIQSSEFKTLGFSLQIMTDLNENGCDDLAVGSPGNAKVMLLRCIPTVTIYVTTKLLGSQIVREQDNTFMVQVCVNMTYQSKSENITDKVAVSNTIIGTEAFIEMKYEKYYIDLSERKECYCENITVSLSDNEAANYTFLAKADIEETNTRNTTEFNKSWVSVNPSSKLEADELVISRNCTGDDCRSSLSMSLDWSGRNISFYTVGSTPSETVTIQLRNDGKSVADACALIYVVGPHVSKIGCGIQDEGYLCHMPTPFKRNTEYVINIKLNMSGFSNMDKFMSVTVQLREFCEQSENATQKILEVPLVLNPNDVHIDGVTRNETLTDKIMLDRKIQTIIIEHEYKIINNGTVFWKDLKVIAGITEEPYIDLTSSRVYSTENIDCVKHTTVECRFNLMPHSTVNFFSSVVVQKNLTMQYLHDNVLDISTNLTFIMDTASVLPHPATVKELRLLSTLTLHKDLTLGQDKNLIIIMAIVLALVILTVIIVVLWKVGFFKRQQKQQLQEEIRKMSIKQSTSSGVFEACDVDMDLDDDAFDIPQNDTTADTAPLHVKTEDRDEVLNE